MTQPTNAPPDAPKINLEAPVAVRRSAVRNALESLGITNVDNLLHVHMNATRIELEYLARTDNGKIRVENGDPVSHTIRIQVTSDGQTRPAGEADGE